jgi:hypothetical protein
MPVRFPPRRGQAPQGTESSKAAASGPRLLPWLAPRARRWAQLTLGAAWLLDGALQLQPYMLGKGLAQGIIEPAGQGQPGLVADSVKWAARLILSWPAGFDLIFALVQLGIGAAILCRRTLRLGLAGSIAWAVAVWWFGEAAGQVTGGDATLITGAPGSVLLYAMIALLVWPKARTSRWAGIAWTALWTAGALLQLLPAQHGADSVASAINSGAAMSPHWLASIDLALGRAASGAGGWAPAAVTALFLVIAAAPYMPRAARIAGLSLGALTALGIWLVGQGLGDFTTGQATDPNTGPLLVLLAFVTAVAASAPLAWDTGRWAPESADPALPVPATGSRAPAPAFTRHRRGAWSLAAVAALCAVAIAGSGQPRQPAPSASTAMGAMPTTSPGTASPAMPSMTQPVVVKVGGNSAAKIYLDLDVKGRRSYTQRTVKLPYSVDVTGQAESVAVIAQAQGGTATATIDCAIVMDGMSMATNRASGANSLVSCEADP